MLPPASDDRRPPLVDPHRANFSIDCGAVYNSDATAGVGLTLTANAGDGDCYFTLVMASGRKEIILHMGAAEWPKFLAAVKQGERVLAELIRERRTDELTPCPPG